MKISAIAIAGLALASCGPAEPSTVDNGKNVKLWTDPTTGCVYLLYGQNQPFNNAVGSLSIRFRADGTPDCPGAKK